LAQRSAIISEKEMNIQITQYTYEAYLSVQATQHLNRLYETLIWGIYGRSSGC